MSHSQRLRTAFVLTFVCLLLSSGGAGAAPDPERVQMSLDRYAELMTAARRQAAGQLTWARGEVKVRIQSPGAAAAVVTVSGLVKVTGAGPTEAPLLPADVVLRSARIDGDEGTLLRSGGTYSAVLSPGEHQIELVYLAPTQGAGDGAPFIMAPLPPMPGAALSVQGPGGPLSVLPGIGLKRSGDTLTASLPSTPAVVVRWGGAVSQNLVRRVDYIARPDAEGMGVTVEATLEVRLGGKRGVIRVANAATGALVDVREGNRPLSSQVIDGWHTALVEGAGRHIVKATLRLPIDRSQGQPQITLNPDTVPMARVEITVPGKRQVKFDPEVPLTTRFSGAGERSTTTAVGHLPPSNAVTIRWTEARAAPESQVRVNTETYQLITLQEGVLRSKVIIEYDVIQGRTKDLPIELPANVVLYKVNGPGVDSWQVFPKTETEPRHVRVMLGEELGGSLRLELELEMAARNVEGTVLDLPIVKPMKAFRQPGVIALFDGEKVGFAPAEADAGYTKVGQDALPVAIRQTLGGDKVSQAFKHIDAPGVLRSKVATAKTREVRFDVRALTYYEILEGSVHARAVAELSVKSGRIDTFYLTLPEAVADPQIGAPDINKWELAKDFDAPEGRKAYVVKLTQKRKGTLSVNVSFEMLLEKGQESLQLPDLRIHGAEVQSGAFAIAGGIGVEITDAKTEELRSMPTADLPRRISGQLPVGDAVVWLGDGYRFIRSPWAMQLTFKRHATVQTEAAVARSVVIETNILESGHWENRVVYEIRSTKKHARLTLPQGARLHTIHIDGAPVAAGQENADGPISIPLKERPGLRRIEVQYEVKHEAHGSFGTFPLRAPKIDMRAKSIVWRVRAAQGLSLYSVDGDLKLSPQGVEPTEWTVDELARDPDMQQVVLRAAVIDANTSLSADISYAATPGEASNTGLLIIALLLLCVVTARRARGLNLDGKHWIMLVGGAAALLLKAIGWSLSVEETVIVVVVVSVVGLFARKGRAGAADRQAEDAADA